MSLIVIFFLAWAVFFILLKFVEALTSGALSRHLVKRNVTLKFGYISVYTTYFNHTIENFASARRRLLNVWFFIGVIFGFMGLLLSVSLLSANVAHNFASAVPDVPKFASFRPRSRIPFVDHRPGWLPRHLWKLFLATDHHPSAVVRRGDIPDLHASARHFSVDSWHDPRMRPRGSPFHHGGHGREGVGKWGGGRYRMGRFPRRGGGGGGRPGCGHRREMFRKKVGRVIHIPMWERKKRKRQYSFMRPGGGEGVFEVDSFEEGAVHPGHHHRRHPFHSRRLLSVVADGAESTGGDSMLGGKGGVGDGMTNGSRDGDGGRREDEGVLRNEEVKGEGSFLTPLIPGVTVPAGDVWYMLVSVAVAAVVHELGHALAAGAADGGISGIGAFIAVLLPGAYVRLTGVEDMRPWQQLRVYCAGAWHNVVSAFVALGVVGVLPVLFAPGYVVGGGAMVVGVPMVSPLFGHVGRGDVVVQIGGRVVVDGGESFRGVVGELVQTGESVGFCLAERVVRNVSRRGVGCCEGDGGDDGLQCFRMRGWPDRRACLDVGDMTTKRMCRSVVDCGGGGERMACMVPVLSDGKQLVDVHVQSGQTGEKEVLFYEGFASILGQSVTVSSFVPRGLGRMPAGLRGLLAAADLPNVAERFLQYMASISMGLAVLNMAPVFLLDGEGSVGLFVRVLWKGVAMKRVKGIRTVVLTGGSLLLLCNLVMGVLTMRRG